MSSAVYAPQACSRLLIKAMTLAYNAEPTKPHQAQALHRIMMMPQIAFASLGGHREADLSAKCAAPDITRHLHQAMMHA
jgi:hypothetical protein